MRPIASQHNSPERGTTYSWHARSEPSLTLWIGLATLLVLLGLADDRWRLPWTVRLVCHFCVATLAVWWGGLEADSLSALSPTHQRHQRDLDRCTHQCFQHVGQYGWLSSGSCGIVSAALLVILLHGPHPSPLSPNGSGRLNGTAVGSQFGFSLSHANPARLFMGDAEATSSALTCCDYVASQLWQLSSRHMARHVGSSLPLAVPFYDMFSVIGIRLRERRSPFQADHCHLSHRLLALGLSRGQAVGRSTCCVCDMRISGRATASCRSSGCLVVLILVLCVLGVTAMLESAGARRK